MSAGVFTGTIFNAMKRTLDMIITDDSDGAESGMICTKIFQVKTMEDAYEDDQEYGGPGLAAEVDEGTEIPLGSIKQGYTKRYRARKFGLRLIVSEEAIEDNKYSRVIDAAKRLRRSLFKTKEYDCSDVFARATNSNYPGGDGVPLASDSHPLPHGGTFSNMMATPMTPSRQAVIAAVSAIKKLPSQDGTVEGWELKKIVCPTEQWAVWDGLVLSQKAPEAGAFNEINVVHRLNPEVIENKYWDNTTTNWACITDAEGGLQIRDRRKPRSRSWVENSQEMMNYSISARWDRGWSDARGVYFVDA